MTANTSNYQPFSRKYNVVFRVFTVFSPRSFPYLHVPVHVITMGDARCDWLKCNPLKLIEVQGEQRMRALCPRGFSHGFAARTGGQTKRREVFLSIPREKKSHCYPGYKRFFFIFLFSWFSPHEIAVIEPQRKFEENLWDQDTPTYLLTTSVNRSKKWTPSGRGCKTTSMIFSLAIIDRSVSSTLRKP